MANKTNLGKGVIENPFEMTYFINDEESINKLMSLIEKLNVLKIDETIELNNFHIHYSIQGRIFFHKTFVDENDLSEHPSQILTGATRLNPSALLINTIVIVEDRPFKDYLEQEGIHYIEAQTIRAQTIDETEQ